MLVNLFVWLVLCFLLSSFFFFLAQVPLQMKKKKKKNFSMVGRIIIITLSRDVGTEGRWGIGLGMVRTIAQMAPVGTTKY